MNNPQERDDVPVLTEVVEDGAAVDALAERLEHALLERLGPEIDRVTARALHGLRAELTLSVTRMVREAVAAAVARTLGPPRRD